MSSGVRLRASGCEAEKSARPTGRYPSREYHVCSRSLCASSPSRGTSSGAPSSSRRARATAPLRNGPARAPRLFPDRPGGRQAARRIPFPRRAYERDRADDLPVDPRNRHLARRHDLGDPLRSDPLESRRPQSGFCLCVRDVDACAQIGDQSAVGRGFRGQEVDLDVQRLRDLRARWICRSASRLAMSRRLSRDVLPRATASSILARPFFQ